MRHLVIYYSYSGMTKGLAEDIALILDCEIRELIMKNPYSFTYNTAIKELRTQIETGHCPELINGLEAIENFDLIFIGSPNWLKTFAPPILTFLRNVNLKGKTLIPFCTHGGGGFGRMIEDLKKECKDSEIREGLALKSGYNFDELQNWLNENL